MPRLPEGKTVDIYMAWGLAEDGRAYLVDAFDEFSYEENPDGWDEVMAMARTDYNEDADVFVTNTEESTDDPDSESISLIWVSDDADDPHAYGKKWVWRAWPETDLNENWEGYEEDLAHAKATYKWVEVTETTVSYGKIVKALTTLTRV